MSVLFKSPSNNSVSIGGSNKGFPPGDIINIYHTANSNKVLIKWTDPEDTIIDGITIAKWKGTILIRNSDHYPTSIKDGDVVIDNTEKNKYKDNYYEDIGLINNHIYYYRFFSYSDENIYNDSSNLIFKDKPLSFAPILKDNTWEQIAAASESGNIPSTWKVGDEIDLVLSGDFNETVTLQIWDFNHFDKSDGTGKAGICFGMKHLMKNTQDINGDNDTTTGGWNKCIFREKIIPKIYNSIPIELRNNIKEVKTEANKGGRAALSQSCIDNVFLPGIKEMGDLGNNYDGNQVKFPIFSDHDSRLKKFNNGTDVVIGWWSRSPDYYHNGHFRVADSHGNCSNNYTSWSNGVCFCFNV